MLSIKVPPLLKPPARPAAIHEGGPNPTPETYKNVYVNICPSTTVTFNVRKHYHSNLYEK